MSERRKSGFPPRNRDGESSKSRPIILKSDREREPKKEVVKPKEEEIEKQPTILLKTREQTPKEEKAAPVRNNVEHPVQPTRAEAKDKKFTEVLLPQEMPRPVKLIDECMKINPAASEWLQEANTSFLVVGIIGEQGVGKSTVMNILAKENIPENITKEILDADFITYHEPHRDDQDFEHSGQEGLHFVEENSWEGVKESEENRTRFKTQNLEQIELGLHCTEGIEMYITKDRVILLDAQPPCSASLLDDAIARDSRSVGPLERITHTDSMQIASYLMSVCHILIVMQDNYIDYNFIRFLLSSEMVRAGVEGANNCHLLVLHNRCRMEQFTTENVKGMQEFYRKAFAASKLQLTSGMYMYADGQCNGVNLDPVEIGMNVDSCGDPINLFLLPDIYDDEDNEEIYRGHPSFASLCRRLRWQIFGANRHQLSNLQNMTEKCWFQFCTKTWEAVQKCSFYLEYTRIMH